MDLDLIELRAEGLEIGEVMRWVSDPAAGGLAFFAGTTRAEVGGEMGALVALEYHGYEAMAIAELRKIAAAARGAFPILRLAILHRLGRVKVGEASVIIGVATRHRGEAFAACEFVIDRLKETVPIWKHEHFERGTRWQKRVGETSG